MSKRAVQISVLIAVLIAVTSIPGEARYRGGIWIGAPIWGVPYPYPYYSYPYRYPYPYPEYYYQTPPPVVIERQPETYIQKAPTPQPEQTYWYYCPTSQAFYPAVKECPGGWMKVVPSEPDDLPDQAPQPPEKQ